MSSPRVYMHSILNQSFSGWPEHTLVVECASDTTFRKLKLVFKEELMKKHFSKELIKLPIMTQGVLRSEDGNEYKDTQNVLEVLHDRDDVFFELRSVKPTIVTQPPVRVASSPTPKVVISDAKLLSARDLQTKGQLKRSRDIYLQILSEIPAPSPKDRQVCHQQLGIIYLSNKKYDLARPHLESAVKLVSSDETAIKQIGKVSSPELSQLVSSVGQCYYGLGIYGEAQSQFERSLKLVTPNGVDDISSQSTIKDTKVWLARSMYNQGDKSNALKIFEKLIAQDENHIGALCYYSQIAIECGKKKEIIPYLLRALVASQSAATVKGKKSAIDPQLVDLAQSLLTDIVQLPGGVRNLFSELHEASNNHSVLMFVAQIVKDQGGVSASIEIYKHALKVSNELKSLDRCGMYLNLVHTQELEYSYQEAFGHIKDFMKENQNMSIGHNQLKIGDFYAAIKNIDDVYDVRLRTGDAPGVPTFFEIGKIFDEGFCQVAVPNVSDVSASTKAAAATFKPFLPNDLQVIALMMTAVKILYVCGGLQVLPTLITLVEPIRVDRDLHLTIIRNEHAYYSSIAQMMKYIPFPIPRELASCPLDDTIYVCGDSHSMSSAWQVVKLDSHPRPMIIQPKLVTGLKVWHMRPECRFYTKRNFEAAMKSIPDNAQVIFNFGEIDCREGLLVSVEKGRYENVEEGVQLAVDVYVKTMQELIKTKKMQIYVHPITPVLDVTRTTVKIFEQQLSDRCSTSNGKLIHLDFFKGLLTPDGNHLNMDYNLDSTHLNPIYVPKLLRGALNKVFVPRQGKILSTMDIINQRLSQSEMMMKCYSNEMD